MSYWAKIFTLKFSPVCPALWAVHVCAIGTCPVNSGQSEEDQSNLFAQQVPLCIGRRFLKIPADIPMQNKWLASTGRKSDNFGKKSLLEFCTLHFTIDQFKPDILKIYKNSKVPRSIRVIVADAVPSIRLGVGPLHESRDKLAIERAQRTVSRSSQQNESKDSNNHGSARYQFFAEASPVQDELQTSGGANSMSMVPDEVENLEMEELVSRNKQSSPIRENLPSEAYKQLVRKLLRRELTSEDQVDTEAVSSVILLTLSEKIDSLERQKEALKVDADKRMRHIEEENESLREQLKTALTDKDEIMIALQRHLSKAQINRLLNNKNSHWSTDDYATGIQLLGISKKFYTYLRTHKKFLLPCISSVKRFVSKFDFEPGLLKNALNLLNFKGMKLSDLEKLVVLSYDEMHLSNKCCYDSKLDQVLGPCRQVQVIHARGLFGKWKCPIFYEYDAPVTPELLNAVVSALHDIGFQVVAVVSDLAKTNEALVKKLGATVENPFFPHPITEEPIFCFNDGPHNLKLCRNHLLDSGIDLTPQNDSPHQHASKDVLCELVAGGAGLDMLPHKMTLSHLSVQGSGRQNVLKATQVLSESTSKSLLAGKEKGFLKSPNAEATAKLCYVMNSYFDLFNTKENKVGGDSILSKDLPFGAALEEQKEILSSVKQLVEEMRVIGKKNLLPFQRGILMSCTALPQLHSFISKKFPSDNTDILTYHLSQDVLELLFAMFRLGGGTYTNPDAVELKRRIRKVLLGKNPQLLLTDKTSVQVNTLEANYDNVITIEAIKEINSINEVLDTEHQHDEPSEDEPLPNNEEGNNNAEPIEEESSDEEDEDLEFLAPPTDSPNTMAASLYKDGLISTAELIAGSLQKTYPYLVSQTSAVCPTSCPEWMKCHRNNPLRASPSCALVQMVKDMDAVFNEMHGDSVDREKLVTQRFLAKVLSIRPEIPKEVVQKFGFLRLTSRRNGINELLEVQKRERKNTKAAKKVQASQECPRLSDADSRQSRAGKRARLY